MSERPESRFRTLAVAAGVALFCSLLVSSVVYWLRPLELAYSAIDRNRAIVRAAGIGGADAALDDRAVVERFVELERRIVDLASGDYTDAVDAKTYDYRAAENDPLMRVDIPGALDVARLKTRPRYMPVYILPGDRGPSRIVLPVYGRGMWSTIYAYVALESDLTTIAGVAIFEHGETPGIGDRIENPSWLGQWVGKRIYAADGAFRFTISSDTSVAAADYRVDGITGATVSSSGVNDAVRFWFSADGYGPFLERLRGQGR